MWNQVLTASEGDQARKYNNQCNFIESVHTHLLCYSQSTHLKTMAFPRPQFDVRIAIPYLSSALLARRAVIALESA